MKTFNITGVCVPEKHYMVDISERLCTIEKMIEKGQYFTINRARQYGKTTTLFLLERKISNQYLVINLSFEAAEDLFVSNYSLASGLIRRISKKLKNHLLDQGLLSSWEQPISREFPLDDFGDRISELCDKCGKGIVLIIDEVDKSSDNQIFLSFLALLRSKYLDQQKGEDKTFQSVILSGVYDVKNLKLKLHPDEESRYYSPWNIAVDFTLSMDFDQSQIANMLVEYEQDHCTGMDIQFIAGLLYEYTSGYPYLVSRLCRIMDEELTECSDYKYESSSVKVNWTHEGFLDAVKLLLGEVNTLFDDMLKKLKQYPALKEMLYEILYLGKSFPFNIYQTETDIASMFGYVTNQNGNVVIANRIFEIWMYNLFVSEERMNSRIYSAGAMDKNQFTESGHLNMEKILERFLVHYNDLYGDKDDTFHEKEGRKYFLFYLKPIINGTGNYYIEAQTRDEKRTDVIVDFHGEQSIIEMKIWHGQEYNNRGEKQLIEYLDYYHLDKGYMLSFNFNKNKKSGMRRIHIGDKILIEAVC